MPTVEVSPHSCLWLLLVSVVNNEPWQRRPLWLIFVTHLCDPAKSSGCQVKMEMGLSYCHLWLGALLGEMCRGGVAWTGSAELLGLQIPSLGAESQFACEWKSEWADTDIIWFPELCLSQSSPHTQFLPLPVSWRHQKWGRIFPISDVPGGKLWSRGWSVSSKVNTFLVKWLSPTSCFRVLTFVFSKLLLLPKTILDVLHIISYSV